MGLYNWSKVTFDPLIYFRKQDNSYFQNWRSLFSAPKMQQSNFQQNN